MPLWLQIISGICAATGAALGLFNSWVQWSDKKERLQIFIVAKELNQFRVRNPTVRPIEVVGVYFDSWDAGKKGWVERFSNHNIMLDVPFTLEPHTSKDIYLHSSQNLELVLDKARRLRLITSANVEYVRRIG